MTVPCLMGLKCPHCIDDEDYDPVCCHPFTIDTINEENWRKANGLCMDMTTMDCPLVEDDSELEYLLSFTEDYNPEEWASLMSMLRVAVHRRGRANSSLDDMKGEVALYVFRLWLDMMHDAYLERRGGA